MTSLPRYFLKKTDKLKSRKAIGAVFTSGKSFSVFPFKVLWLPVENEAVLQAGVTASSRNFKHAVDRNRIKRLMREAYRLQKNDLQQQIESSGKGLHVFILYTGKELPEYDLVFEKFTSILKRLIKLTNENSAADM